MANAKDDLEAFAAKVPAGPARDLVERLLADPYEAARAAMRIAIQMGSNKEWPGADYLEWIADQIGWTGTFNHPGEPDNVKMYRQLADAAGMEHDGDEEEEDDEED